MTKNFKKKHATVNTNSCVACGICTKNCPIKAITIFNGLYAKVDLNKCVGCSKCSNFCPASIISMEENK